MIFPVIVVESRDTASFIFVKQVDIFIYVRQVDTESSNFC